MAAQKKRIVQPRIKTGIRGVPTETFYRMKYYFQLDLEKKMAASTIKMNEERTRQMARGDAMISISADGLEPELEAFMWRIIEKVQVRAAESQAEFLLGIA